MNAEAKRRKSWLGKAAGAGLGLVTGGPVGLAIGAVAGHLFDRVADRSRAPAIIFRQDHIDGLFRLAGHLAKADGFVTQAEINEATRLMDKLRLEPRRRSQAIRFFNDGKQPLYRPDHDLYRLNSSLNVEDKEALLSLLLRLAFADKPLNKSEQKILKTVRDVFGISPIRYLWIRNRVRMNVDWLSDPRILPETSFRLRRRKQADSMDYHYMILGAEADATDDELKRIYRRKMSEYHPDRMQSRGVSDTEMSRATEKAQAVQAAYRAIRNHRRGTR